MAAHAAAAEEREARRVFELQRERDEPYGYCPGIEWVSGLVKRCGQDEAVTVLRGRVEAARAVGGRIIRVEAPVGAGVLQWSTAAASCVCFGRVWGGGGVTPVRLPIFAFSWPAVTIDIACFVTPGFSCNCSLSPHRTSCLTATRSTDSTRSSHSGIRSWLPSRGSSWMRRLRGRAAF